MMLIDYWSLLGFDILYIPPFYLVEKSTFQQKLFGLQIPPDLYTKSTQIPIF